MKVLLVAVVGIFGFSGFVEAQNSGSETGELSVYAIQYQGRATSSGELYDPNLLTAAHRTLPLGTMLRVANFETGRMVDVRVNDRKGDDGNILTLSHAAAARVGLVENRTAPGSCLVITPPQQTAMAPGSPATATSPVIPYSAASTAPIAQAEQRASGFQPIEGLKREIATRKAAAGGSANGGLFKKKAIYGIPASQYQPYVNPAAPAPPPLAAQKPGGLAGLFQKKNEVPSRIAAPRIPIAGQRELIPLNAPAQPPVVQRPSTPIASPPQQGANPYRVQFGAFRRVSNAQELQAMLGNAGIPTLLSQSTLTGLNLVITQGTFASAEDAQRWIDFEGARRGWTDRPVVIR